LHEWYLIVYADADEWVEVPNRLGMSQFGDGGLLASKPDAASGAYIDKMPDDCRSCAYDVKARAGSKACPFDALYWDFIARHRQDLKNNPRMAQTVRLYDQFSEAENGRIKESAAAFLATLKPSAEWPWVSHRVRFLSGKKNAAAKPMRARRRCFGGAARLPPLTGRGPAVVSVFLPELFA
jgi:hypothetical protein